MPTPRPTDIILHRASHTLEVAFDTGERFDLPCEYLRVHSPSAEVQGHGPGQQVLIAGKRDVNIDAIEPIGNYGVLLRFSDGHATGIFSWSTLYDLGVNQERNWKVYLEALEKNALNRDHS
ncbi:MAG: 1-(5-phosphoribosyl)-5-((5-phosphoribosylamino)methylideneamino)imidazole-4-carboxamide isomerase [Rhodanobacteraceae bacterium]